MILQYQFKHQSMQHARYARLCNQQGQFADGKISGSRGSASRLHVVKGLMNELAEAEPMENCLQVMFDPMIAGRELPGFLCRTYLRAFCGHQDMQDMCTTKSSNS